MSKKRNSLIFMPDWSDYNAYQKLLYDSIALSGIACKGLSPKEFTFRWIWKNRCSVKYIHLHWLFAIYDPDRSGLTVSLLFKFIFKIIVSRIVGYKIIWTVHNLMSHEPTNCKLESIIRKLVCSLAENILVHCDYAKNKIIDLWKADPDKVYIIPHGSYVGYYPNSVNKENARAALHINKDSFVFLFFGMIRYYKGIQQLLKSFLELAGQSDRYRLVIAGSVHDDSLVKEILDMTTDERILINFGFVKDEDVQIYFNSADIVVLPYADILTSGATVLSLSFGKPVIAPNKGCIPELVSNDIGFLYDHISQLSNLMKYASHVNDLNPYCMSAIRKAESISWDKIVRLYYEFRVLSQHDNHKNH